MADIAAIGTREKSDWRTEVCQKLGRWVVQCGHTLHSGNAEGSDQDYARGANSVDPSRVHLHLPWGSFNRGAVQPGNYVHIDGGARLYQEIASEFHAKWDSLSQGAKRLHTRNVGIVQPCQLVLAWPSDKPWGGGTGLGMKVAREYFDIEVVELQGLGSEELARLCRRIAALS